MTEHEKCCEQVEGIEVVLQKLVLLLSSERNNSILNEDLHQDGANTGVKFDRRTGQDECRRNHRDIMLATQPSTVLQSNDGKSMYDSHDEVSF